MSSIGVPTLLAHSRLTAATSDLRRQSEAARIEVITGRKGDLPLALGRGVGEAHLLQKAINDVSQHHAAIAQFNLRATVAQSAVQSITAGASALNAELIAALGRGDETVVAASEDIARNALEQAFTRLNARVEGRSIFAGDGVDEPALSDTSVLITDIAAIYSTALTPAQFEADLDVYFNDPVGGFATNIYQGGPGEIASIEITKGEIMRGAAKADEQPIKELLRGLVVIAVAAGQGPSPNRDASLRSAGSTLLNAADASIGIVTRIGTEQQRASNAAIRLNEEEAALTAAYNAKTSRDPYEAASRLQNLESQIEAAYVLTSRLSRLSLTNYL